MIRLQMVSEMEKKVMNMEVISLTMGIENSKFILGLEDLLIIKGIVMQIDIDDPGNILGDESSNGKELVELEAMEQTQNLENCNDMEEA
ncbi:MAG: hypothetical protein EZS28_047173 [Streblomastix strix]|uniref:Uncharacterized protein n=1 Tax=Streblomastix strix TaxID=222440 RepID=A0A5J4THS2_9EUKA|nr:MAG: hypothetical protein EZS28_047173 [Streblomastix strix]